MTSIILLIIALLGGLVYALTDGKPSAIAKDVMWTSLLAFFLNIAGIVKLLS
jgi:hypothetical protein